MPTAAHSSRAPQVTPLAAAAAPRTGYCRCYRVALLPGECLLQRVRVHVRFVQGGQRLADFRQTYYEFFAAPAGPGEGPVHAIDVHDFDLLRDGWRQAVIVGLVREQRRGGPALPRGEAVLDVRKQFLLGHGDVVDDAGVIVDGGARFGLLRGGPGGASGTVLRIRDGAAAFREITSLCPGPRGHRVAGTGTFTAARGLRAFEHFRYRYANQTGTFSDNGGYLPGVLE
ncbi:MAG: hypothetical protein H6835_07805 [Planctomycetes bacterium]|nr:hypothetical protein [Planctomycetota bacterium]